MGNVDNPIGIQIFIVIVMAVVLIRAIMKLPKKIAIATGVFMLLSMTVIVYMAVYQFDTLNSVLSIFNMKLDR